MTQLFIFLFLLLLSVCKQASSTHCAARGRWGTLRFLLCKQEGAGNDGDHQRKEGEKIACTPRLLPSSPQKSPSGEFISLALLDCLLVQCASPVLNRWWKKKRKIPWERLVSRLQPESMHPKSEAQTAQADTLPNQLPTLLSNQSFPSHLEEATGDLSPTVSYVLRRGRLPQPKLTSVIE